MVWNSEDAGPDSGGASRNDRQRIEDLETAVADLQRRLAALEGGGATLSASTSPYGTAEPAVNDAVDPWSVAPWPEIVALVQGQKKIQAIKVYREYYRVGLKEAKDAVDEVERRVRG